MREMFGLIASIVLRRNSSQATNDTLRNVTLPGVLLCGKATERNNDPPLCL